MNRYEGLDAERRDCGLRWTVDHVRYFVKEADILYRSTTGEILPDEVLWPSGWRPLIGSATVSADTYPKRGGANGAADPALLTMIEEVDVEEARANRRHRGDTRSRWRANRSRSSEFAAMGVRLRQPEPSLVAAAVLPGDALPPARGTAAVRGDRACWSLSGARRSLRPRRHDHVEVVAARRANRAAVRQQVVEPEGSADAATTPDAPARRAHAAGWLPRADAAIVASPQLDEQLRLAGTHRGQQGFVDGLESAGT